MLQIQYAKTLIGKIKQISPTLFEVDKHSVKIQTKKGRVLVICDCFNDTKFCIESPICVHKLSVIIYLSDNNFNEKIKKVISDYERYKKIGLDISPELMLDDLENLRRVK